MLQRLTNSKSWRTFKLHHQPLWPFCLDKANRLCPKDNKFSLDRLASFVHSGGVPLRRVCLVNILGPSLQFRKKRKKTANNLHLCCTVNCITLHCTSLNFTEVSIEDRILPAGITLAHELHDTVAWHCTLYSTSNCTVLHALHTELNNHAERYTHCTTFCIALYNRKHCRLECSSPDMEFVTDARTMSV